MIAYRDARCEVATAAELGRIAELARGRDTENLLISAGELEQGVVDALQPASDAWQPVHALLRDAVCAAAAAHLAARTAALAQRSVTGALDRVRALLAALRRHALPATITIKAPEGFSHYGLDPAAYAASAALYAAQVGGPRAARAGIVGVRSIGTTLSAVVAAALSSERSITVRPRGPSGHRRVIADTSVQARIAGWMREMREHIDGSPDIIIVDEGPGATGETFACVAAWLCALGVDRDRIVLFAHHGSGMSLAPPERRAWYADMRKHIAPQNPCIDDCAGSCIHQVASALDLELTDDLSAGRWRTVVSPAAVLPSCPHHERRKVRARTSGGALVLLRYAGRGRWGQATVARAQRLAELGMGARVHGHCGGFMALSWIDGRPVRPSECREPAFGQALAAYLAARAGCVAGCFVTGQLVDDSALIALLLENAREALGANPPGLSAAIQRMERLGQRPAVIADARLMRHEWLRTATGYSKVDAVDHGDGIRPPGPVDAAWDVAGAAIEYRLDGAQVAALCNRCAPACARSGREFAAAVRAYRAPYAACALGEMALSAREAATAADRQRLGRHAARYAGALRRELQQSCDNVTRVVR